MTAPKCPETVGKSGKPVAASTAYKNYGCRCGVCTASQAERQAERYVKLKAEGTCTSCQKRDAVEGKTKCQPCLDEYTEWRAKLKAEGTCTSCQKRDAVEGKTKCQPCRDEDTERYVKLKAEGTCTSCQKRDAVEGKTQCQPCLDEYTEWRAKLKAEGRCQDCGAEGLATETRCPDCSFQHYLGDRERRIKKRRESVRERIPERGGRA